MLYCLFCTFDHFTIISLRFAVLKNLVCPLPFILNKINAFNRLTVNFPFSKLKAYISNASTCLFYFLFIPECTLLSSESFHPINFNAPALRQFFPFKAYPPIVVTKTALVFLWLFYRSSTTSTFALPFSSINSD